MRTTPGARRVFAEFDGDKQFATTLARGLEILRCFTPEGADARQQGSRRASTGLPKPTMSRFTYTLSRLGYLQGRPHLVEVSARRRGAGDRHPLLATMTLRQVARSGDEGTRRLRGRLGVDGRARPAQHRLRGDQPQSSSMFSRQLSDIGLSQPIAATAIGRAYLAACTPAEREAMLQRNPHQDAGRSGSATTRRCMQSLGRVRTSRLLHVMGRPAARCSRGRRAAAAASTRRDRRVQLRDASVSGEARRRSDPTSGRGWPRWCAGSLPYSYAVQNNEIRFRISKQHLAAVLTTAQVSARRHQARSRIHA